MDELRVCHFGLSRSSRLASSIELIVFLDSTFVRQSHDQLQDLRLIVSGDCKVWSA